MFLRFLQFFELLGKSCQCFIIKYFPLNQKKTQIFYFVLPSNIQRFVVYLTYFWPTHIRSPDAHGGSGPIDGTRSKMLFIKMLAYCYPRAQQTIWDWKGMIRGFCLIFISSNLRVWYFAWYLNLGIYSTANNISLTCVCFSGSFINRRPEILP